MRRAIILLVLPLLTGCATWRLMEAASAQQTRDKVTLDLVSARIAAADDGTHLYLCLIRTRMRGDVRRSVLIRVAEPYPFAKDAPLSDKVQLTRDSRTIDALPSLNLKREDTLVFAIANDRNVSKICDQPSAGGSIKQIPVLETKQDEHFALPEDTKEAVVFSRTAGNYVGVAYASAAPVFGNHHFVAINIASTDLYSEYTTSKPYLLVFLPVTVVVDAIIFPVVALSSAVSRAHERD